MPKWLISIGSGIEVGAVDLFKWITGATSAAQKYGPKAIAGLAVLAAAVDKALTDVEAAAANPTTLLLNLETDIADMKAVWPDVKALLADLGIKA